MCQCMEVSKNSFYHWQGTDYLNSPLKKKSHRLRTRVRSIFYDNMEIYGSYRIQKKLEQEGLFYSRSYVARIMKKLGLKSVLRKQFTITTDSNHRYTVAENLLNREFKTTKLGEKWVSEITYIKVNDTWSYLTTMIDLADRKVIGWSYSKDMTTENTVLEAWNRARQNRTIIPGFILHSDRGVQYASNKMTKILSNNTWANQSMSRKGNYWDNAVAESFFKSLKYEWIYRFNFKTYSQAENQIEKYINWYNAERLHSSLGYVSPLQMEQKLRNENIRKTDEIKNVA